MGTLGKKARSFRFDAVFLRFARHGRLRLLVCIIPLVLLVTLSILTSGSIEWTTPKELTITDIIDDDEGIDPLAWSKLKIAVYMTSHMSKSHVHFLQKCWPFAVDHFHILKDAHLILYSSEQPDPALLEPLNFASTTVHLFQQLELPVNASRHDIELVKQTGAKRAMTDPFEPANQWFKGYDWVVRLNPDVLIRREKWLRQQLLRDDIDGIFIDYSTPHKHLFQTDFYAFRPDIVNSTAVFEAFDKERSAEMHLGAAFLNFRTSGRWAKVPGTTKIGLAARVLGRTAPVVHDHKIVRQCPNYLNATDGEWYR